MSLVMVADPERTDNATAIADCAQLGYLRKEWSTLDPTYGYGRFWTKWRPDYLIGTDKNPQKSPGEIGVESDLRLCDRSVDFREMPWLDRTFDAVVFDPPYKLSGTPDMDAMDERYGIDVPERWQDRMQLCVDGVRECARVSDRMLLIKCQDQVCSGRMRWQTREFAEAAEGFRLVTHLQVSSYLPQPPGRSQKHPRNNFSTLLVLERSGR